MKLRTAHRRSRLLAIALGMAALLTGCDSNGPEDSKTQGTTPATTADVTTAPPAEAGSWTPEALEDLLAPIALYPDPVLSQVLIASTNPQELLDAGNWLLQNEKLKGDALDQAATEIGFTPPIRALVQFPQTVDLMCRELDWTTELGQAFVADQAGVLDAVQRLRRQAQEVGNLQDSAQMTVATEQQSGEEVILLKPPSEKVVYVPQYDPVAVYTPAPAAAPVAPVTTTTTTTVEKTGHSTGTLITTGLLAFGAGMLVAELLDDDDKYYYPNYGYGRMPYYPPYPYRPVYGNGFYPGSGYRPPPGYGGGYNNGIIIINNGNRNYWNRYDRNRPGNGVATPYRQPRKVASPISTARPNRPELKELNKRQPRPMPSDVQRPSPKATAGDWKGKSSYAGAPGGGKQSRKTAAAAPRPAKRELPKMQGSYGAASPDRGQGPQRDYGAAKTDRTRMPELGGNRQASRDLPNADRPSTRELPNTKGDRGYERPSSRPMPTDRSEQRNRGGESRRDTAMSGQNRGSAERAASQRGRQSLPQGARSKSGGNRQKKR
ncbi:MAG: DUF3300 domain-containing protein [Burkholderiales bacterium]